MFDAMLDDPAGRNEPTPPLVIYHSPCLDGFTAAWACWLKHPEAEFVTGVYGQEPPNVIDRDVYLLDFNYKRDVMQRMALDASNITILDHHKSAQEDLLNWTELPGCEVSVRFDMSKSGARLAWEWFHPTEEVPLLVKLVEDRDLWKFDLPCTREITAALFSYDYNFGMWNNLRATLETARGYDNLLNSGRAIERKQQKDVKELVEKLRHRRCIGGVDVWCANLPYTLASDAANLMSQGAPFAATYFVDAEGYATFSLRSKDTGVDVAEIAVRYGGGGHKHASGFRVKSLSEL